jgi:hypothetical protein
MKIHFCDLCNESVPQADLDQGRAFIRKDRVVCATCESAMSHGHATATATAPLTGAVRAHDVAPALPNQALAPAPAPVAATAEGTPHVSHLQPIVVRSAGSGGLWVALLGLVFTAGVMFVLDNRIQDIQRDATAQDKRLASQESNIGILQRGASLEKDALSDHEKRTDRAFDAQKSRQDRLVDQLNAIEKEQNDVAARIASLTVLVNKHEAKAGSGDIDLEKRLQELSSRLAKGEDDMNALTARLLAVESTPVPAAVAVAPAPVQPDASQPAWTAQLEGLKSDSNSVRWEAVTGLGATKDPETVPHLLPMLKDSDVFVRMATARVLGEMQAKPAVGALIDSLEDSETAVREAAYIALRTITGKDLKFDPQAIDVERAKRVKAWREWLKKEGEAAPAGT